MHLLNGRAFGPWGGGFGRPFGWPGTEFGQTSTSTAKTTAVQTPTQTATITSVTAITSITSATVVTTVIQPLPASPTPPSSTSSTESHNDSTSSTTLSSIPSSVHATSNADHAPSTTLSSAYSTSGTVIYFTLPGSIITLAPTYTGTPQAAPSLQGSSAVARSQGLNNSQIAAVCVACVAIFALSALLWLVVKRRRRAAGAHRLSSHYESDRESGVRSPTTTLSSGMVEVSSSHRLTVPDATVAYNAHPRDALLSAGASVRSSRLPAYREEIGPIPPEAGATRTPSQDEHGYPRDTKPPSPSAPSPTPPSDEQPSATPNSSTFLLSPMMGQFTLNAIPTLTPLAPIAEPHSYMDANGHTPGVLSPAAATAGTTRTPYWWDPPPSSEYLPPPSRRTTFRSSRFGGRSIYEGTTGAAAGVEAEQVPLPIPNPEIFGLPSPPYVWPQAGDGDRRSEISLNAPPPSYSPRD